MTAEWLIEQIAPGVCASRSAEATNRIARATQADVIAIVLARAAQQISGRRCGVAGVDLDDGE